MNKKKLIVQLVVLALLSGGHAFAANNATSTSVGNDNQSLIQQTGDQQNATVNQGADGAPANGNDSIIDHSETGNLADVDQRGDGVHPSNNSLIIQSGNEDGFNEAYLLQSESGNTSQINQSGDDNVADVDQKSNNDSSVDQTGSRNWAMVQQNDDNFSIVDQSGNRNIADVYQSGVSGDPATGNSSIVTQEGNRNEAYVNQPGLDNTSVIFQRENRNDAWVYQSGDNGSVIINQEKRNLADVDQGGSFNRVEIHQDEQTHNLNEGPKAPRVNSQWNEAYVTQDGENNYVRIDQDDNNTATVTQLGFGISNGSADPDNDPLLNKVTIQQYNNNDHATAWQDGDEGNSIVIRQERCCRTHINNSQDVVNEATAIQNGSLNTTTLVQLD